jgi:hypothetical protein
MHSRSPEEALREFAAAREAAVKPWSLVCSNVGETFRHRVQAAGDPKGFRLAASETFLRLELPLDDGDLMFSINRVDRVFALNTHIGDLGTWRVYGQKSTLRPAQDWLRSEGAQSSIADLRMSGRESLHVCRNTLCFYAEPHRDISQLINQLQHVSDQLPVVGLSKTKASLEGLSPGLRALLSEYMHLALSDDEERDGRIAGMPPAKRRQLLRGVSPFLREINLYLDSFGDQPLSETAMRLGSIAEAAAEIRAADA